MDLWSLIEQINETAAAQKEQLERWEREMGLAPQKRQEREPTELELLLQEWEQARVAPQSPEPEEEELPPEPRGEELPLPELRGEELPLPELRGEELPLPELRGEELPLPELRGEELPLPELRGEELPLPELRGEELPLPELRGEELPLPELRGEELPLPEPRGEELLLPEPRGEELLLPEPKEEELPLPEPEGEEMLPHEPEGEDLLSSELEGKEVKSPPPPQPRPPPLRSSPAPLCAVPRPLLLDTLPVSLDLSSLDLEPRRLQNRSQFGTWFPASLLPSTKTSLRCSQTSLELPLITTSLPLGDWSSLHWVPAADLCPLLQPPVPRLSLRSALANRWVPSSPVRGPYLAGPGRGPIHPRVRPWKRAKMDICGLEGGWLCFRGGGGRRVACVL
ncbi:UNVERIFIED_CONTAM: hypothetical protein FKN15_033857 [Acipenser sinensis]